MIEDISWDATRGPLVGPSRAIVRVVYLYEESYRNFIFEVLGVDFVDFWHARKEKQSEIVRARLEAYLSTRINK